jgi:von Willebrand factor type A domain
MNQLLSMRYHKSLRTYVWLGSLMKTRRVLPVFAMLMLAVFGSRPLIAAEDDGVALAIVYDTSGSMRETVRSASGRPAPKYQIANRALIAVANQIEAFATNQAAGGVRTIHTGLYIFQADHPKEAVKFGPFDAGALASFAKGFSNPNGNTPLGNSLETAANTVLASSLPRKHVLIITDGLNTVGPKPEVVLPRLKQKAVDKQTSISVHFVAFDVDARQFDQLKKQGATVVGASDEAQLNSQLQFILQKKILLEDEEPPQKK